MSVLLSRISLLRIMSFNKLKLDRFLFYHVVCALSIAFVVEKINPSASANIHGRHLCGHVPRLRNTLVLLAHTLTNAHRL